MKRILITGQNSYIGNSLEKWLMREPNMYKISKISLRDESWREEDFSKYDVVYHVAGIAHIKEKIANQNLYYTVNRDLTLEIAQKTKEDGVNHFIFLSSMSVYGVDKGIITKDTPLRPKSAYGKSKLEAEKLINELRDTSFTISILRPPMVYGKNCTGNYVRLAKIARKSLIFPKISNKRSMIYIDNLSEFVKQLIDNTNKGVFFPQNDEYVNTSDMVRLIAEAHARELWITEIFNPIINVLNFSILTKVFGDLVYDSSISNAIRTIPFSETIKLTENNKEVGKLNESINIGWGRIYRK